MSRNYAAALELPHMGIVIVLIVGTVLGWLSAIVIDRDDRVGTAVCAAVGLAGGLFAALAAGDVPLARGVSAVQLLWSAVGAIVAIAATNLLWTRRSAWNFELFDNPAGQRHHRSRPF